ncbi:MAG: alpha/beta hydrolase [Haloarculaceae archaeon]
MTDAGSLDPELGRVVAEFEERGVPPWHALSVESARRLEDELFSAGEGPAMAAVRDLATDGPGGDLPLRVYRPETGEANEGGLPVLVFCHGGGWVLGTLDSADDICRELAARVGCVVVSVDYRLAPEHPFPAALGDASVAAEWVRAHAGSLGGDPARVGIAGTSAGGNLAAASALYAESEGRPPFACQALLYPITDRSFVTDSYRENADGPLLTRRDMEWFWERYLRSPVDEHHPFASVLRAPDPLLGATPGVVATAGHDPLRDEGRAYADRLDEHGDVDAHHFPSLCHGFCSLTDGVSRADEAFDELAASIRTRL